MNSRVKKYSNQNLLKINFALFLTVIFLLLSSLRINAQVTTGTLINEMINLKNLAEYPSPSYNTIQFSSYDRRSTFPDAPGWFENSDGFGGELIPGFEKVLKEPGENGIGEYLICDVEGPGAIVRLWTAAINGNIRMYLDGQSKPVYDGDATSFFTKTYYAIAPKTTIDLNGSFTQNMAGYYPIPFEKRCKIIWEGDIKGLHFYHVNIRQYEKGTRLTTFKSADIKAYSKEIENAEKILSDPDNNLVTVNAEPTAFAATIKSGKEEEILNLSGSKGINYFEMQILDANLETALRQTVLRISFDGASDPQIQSPVGDFFGTASGVNPYRSLPLTVTENGKLICRFFMPFKESASIKIENLGDKEVALAGKVITEKYKWNEGRSMYFRARWRVGHDLLSSYEQPSDIAYLLTSGKGVCVGAAAHMMNPSNVPSTYGNWWGEGDEKIFVDDNQFPVFFGTGSEDYFNYAWSSPDIFNYAYCGQPRNDGPGTKGFVTNYRWHIIDNIPFKNQFAFYMELLSHEPVPGFSYARIIYHYGFRGMHDDNNRISKGDVRPVKLPEKWFPVGKKGSANSVFYQTEDIISGNENTSLVSGRIWAGGQLLEWMPKKVDEKLELNLPISEEGNYMVYITARLTDSSGSIHAKINDSIFTQEGGVIDLKTDRGILSRTFSSGIFNLKQGLQKLTLESSQPGKPIGIDFIWIQKR
ncbi:MAG: DUF2961 domain-containing protein [Bacteroidales bacterium]|nr:DUF2961 domain-containing protein [Bacteroidales bacterium]